MEKKASLPGVLYWAFIIGLEQHVAGCGQSTLNLNWFYVGDHSPYFVALDKGWYTEEGLEPTILTGKGSGDVVKRVDVGSADIGIVDTGVLIVARAQGAKVKVVSMLFDKSPYCMWMWKDSGINSPKDLVGKKIAAPPGDAQRTIFPALAQVNGFDADKVTFVNISAEAKFTALAAKKVDVVFDYYSGAPFFYKAMGQENVKYMMFADWGVRRLFECPRGYGKIHQGEPWPHQAICQSFPAGLGVYAEEPGGSDRDYGQTQAGDR